MKQITFDITLLEPLLVSTIGKDPNTSTTLDYIPGMAIRGALAGKYGRVADLEQEPQFVRFFLSGAYRYGNGYLVVQEKMMWPVPKCWVQLKDQDDGSIYNLIHSEAKEATKGKQSKGFKAVFFVRDVEQRIHTKKPRYEIAVHNARNRKMGRAMGTEWLAKQRDQGQGQPDEPLDGGALFRYQALAEGQTFRAAVACPAEATDAEIAQLKNWLNGDLFLGTSSSAGYGHCRVSGVKVDEVDEPSTAEATTFTLYLASHAIVRHPHTGQTGPYLLEWLQDKFADHTIQNKENATHSRLVRVGGFNTKWGLPLPQSWAIEMGSVWQFTAAKPLTAAQLNQLAHEGIGERRAEGFGQVVLNPDWHDQKTLAVPGEEKGNEPKRPQPAKVHITPTKAPAGEGKRLLAEMEMRLATAELDRLLMAHATEMTRITRNMVKRSQIGRLRLQIRHVLNESNHNLQPFAEYMKGTKDRRVVNEQFRRARLGKEKAELKNFREWLLELAEMPNTVWTLLGLPFQKNWKRVDGVWQRPLLQAEPFVLDETMSRRYAAQLIAAVCEQLARQTGGDE